MNNNGYVFVAAVISRSSWSSNISLVGHENTVEVSVRDLYDFSSCSLVNIIRRRHIIHIFSAAHPTNR